jgi:predicted secreted protein
LADFINWFTWDRIAFGIAVYFVMWWVLLFAVLPFGVRTQDEDGTTLLGTVGSAPSRYRMGRVFMWNTLVSLVAFGIFVFITVGLGLGLEDIPWVGPPID